MATRSEFAASIKAKYPQYQSVDDNALVDRMLEKYPQYRDRVTDDAQMTSKGMGREAEGAFGGAPEASPEKPAAEPSWLDKASALEPRLKPLAAAAGGVAKFAGNVAQSLSTGPINAVAQAVQDKDGVGPVAWQATKNLVKSTINPFVPGENPIQSSEKTLERAGVPNEPRESVNNTPGFLIKQWARNYEHGYTPEDAEGIEDDKVYARPTMQPGWAREIGTATDVLAPTWGAGLASKVASKTVAPALKATSETVGKGLETVGESQMRRVLKPLMRHERKAQKPVEQVVFEHGLDKGDGGASAAAIYDKSKNRLNKLGAKLKADIQAGKDAGARINTDRIINDVVQEMKATKGESPDFYAMVNDIDEAAKDFRARARAANEKGFGDLDLMQGQAFKQYMGHEGAWEQIAKSKGIPTKASEDTRSRLAEAIYHKLTDAIDEGAPEGIRDLNRQISELIPVNQTAGWRQVVESRGNAVGLNDVIGMTATALNPKVWPVLVLNRASKSGTVASKIYRLGELLRTAKTPAERARYEGALRKLGLSEEEIKAGGQLVEASGGKEAFGAQDLQIKNAPTEVLPPNAVPWKPMEASKGTDGKMGAIAAHNRRMKAAQYLQKTLGREPEQGEIYKFLDQHDGQPIPTPPEPPKQTREFKGRRNTQDLSSRDAMIHTGAEGYPTKAVPVKEAPDTFTLNGETYKRVKGGYDNVITYKDSKGRKQTFRGDETIHMDDPDKPFKVAEEAPAAPEDPNAGYSDDFIGEDGKPLFQDERKLNSPKGQILRRQEGGKALITLFKGKADASTWMHEHAHWLRSQLDPEKNAQALASLKGKAWDRDAEERFARAWERYLYDGATPNKNLAPAMATMKTRMRDIYKEIKGTDLEAELPEEMRILFDAVLIGNKKVTPKADKLIRAIKIAGKQAAPRLLIALRNELNQDQPESARQ